MHRKIIALLSALLLLAACVPAQAAPQQDLASVVQAAAQRARDVRASGQAAPQAALPALARSSSLTWAAVLKEYGSSADRYAVSVKPGTNWYELAVEFAREDLWIIPFYADGSAMDPDDRKDTLVSAGQHCLVADEEDYVIALIDIVAADSGDPAPAPTTSSAPSGDIPAISSMQQEGIDLVNALRADVGVSSLQANAVLCAAAQIRANEMAQTGDFSHTRPNGTECFTVMTAPYPVGENIAMNYGSAAAIPEKMQDQWFHSEGHYKNMVNAGFRQMGIAYAQASNGYWYGCQLFSGSGTVTLNETLVPMPTQAPAPTPTAVQTPEPTPVPTAVLTPEPTPVPTAVPTPEPTPVPTQTAAPTQQPGGIPPISSMQQEGIDLVNALRADLGVSSLQANATLCAAAQIRANEMAQTGVFSHTRPNGTMCYTVMTAPYPIGENIAMNYGSAATIPEKMQDQWFHSQGHYENMVGTEYRQMGIAYAQASDGYWYGCQLFSGSGTVTLKETLVPMPTQTPSPTATPVQTAPPVPSTTPTPTASPTPTRTAAPSPGPSSTGTAGPTSSAGPGESGMMPLPDTGYTLTEHDGGRILTGLQAEPGNAYTTVDELLHEIGHPSTTMLEIVDPDGTPCPPDAPVGTGMVLELRLRSGELLEQATIVVMGDVRGSGRMNIAQLTTLAAALLGTKPLEGPYMLAADWNGTGQVDLADLVREARVLTGQNHSL